MTMLRKSEEALAKLPTGRRWALEKMFAKGNCSPYFGVMGAAN